jgi:RHS repeat-associated protein
LATYDGNGNLKQRFNYALGHAPTSYTENGTTYYLLTDQLGSPRVITDSAGQVVKAIEYDAYGNVTADSNPSITLPFGFAGGLKDDDTGLIRFGYRDYDPQTGRWTARDPIGFAGGDTNLYGYVVQNPINRTDIIGLSPNQIQGNGSPVASVSINVGAGIGVSTNIAVSDAGVTFTGGVGVGIGFGVSATGGGVIADGNSSGMGVGVSFSGGAGPGVSVNGKGKYDESGSTLGGGIGVGIGFGATITPINYSKTIRWKDAFNSMKYAKKYWVEQFHNFCD